MFEKIIRRFQIEKSHYDSLGDVVKHLIYSYSLYLISYPIIGIFINAYFWRQTEDITLIAAYNLGFFIALPIGFYLNGLLLRKIHILKLYWIGTVLQGVAAFLAIFMPTLSFDRVLFYGLIYGVGGGLYWGNKNYITLKITKGRNRLYYNTLESSLDLIINIIMPILLGWIIVLGELIGLYTPEIAYRVLMIITLIMLGVSGYVLQSANIYSENISNILVIKPSKYWNLNRLMQTIFWIVNGVNYFIPTVLVLMLVGSEGELGTLESFSALLIALILYYIGRKARTQDTLKIIFWASFIFVIGVIFLNVFFGLIGAIVYSLTYSISSAITWNLMYTTSMAVMDKESEHGHNHNQYALVFDNELFFNVGRIIGMCLFFGIIYYTSQESSLRITPIIIGILQFTMLIPLSVLLKYADTHQAKSSS